VEIADGLEESTAEKCKYDKQVKDIHTEFDAAFFVRRRLEAFLNSGLDKKKG